MKKASGFKMKNPSIAKLAKAAGSPMRKDLPTYDEAWEAMKSYDTEMGNREEKKTKSGTVYSDDEKGYRQFVNDAKVYNAKQKNKNVKRIEPKKPKQTKIKMPTVIEPKAKRTFKDTRLGKFLTTKRVKGAKKKTYNPRLNRFE